MKSIPEISYRALDRNIEINRVDFSSLGATFYVQFYAGQNFTDLYHEEDVTDDKCRLLPSYSGLRTKYYGGNGERGIAGSVRTQECIMMFDVVPCKGPSVRLQPDGKYPFQNRLDLEYPQPGDYLLPPTPSFRRCNDADFQKTVRVDIYAEENYKGPLGRYLNVCGCVNFPEHFDLFHSVNNHENCIILFQYSGCERVDLTPYRMEYGYQPDRSTFIPPWIYRSMSNCEGLNGCASLRATITSIDIITDASEMRALTRGFAKTQEGPRSSSNSAHYQLGSISSNNPKFTSAGLQMSAKSVFVNNGTGTVSQKYTASKMIRETVRVETIHSITSMHDVKVEGGAKASKEDFGNITGLNAEASVGAAYNYNKNYADKSENMREFTTEKQFTVSQTIEIPPCTMYVVNSIIQMVEGFPLKYEIQSKISGRAGERNLTAEELRPVVQSKPRLIYVRDVDSGTVLVKSRASLTVDFGLETKITAQEYPVSGCKSEKIKN